MRCPTLTRCLAPHARACTHTQHGFIAGGLADGSICLWNPERIIHSGAEGGNALLARLPKHQGAVKGLEFNVFRCGGGWGAGEDRGEAAEAAAGCSRACRCDARRPSASLPLARFTRSPNLLASGGADGELCIWDVGNPATPSLYPAMKGGGPGVQQGRRGEQRRQRWHGEQGWATTRDEGAVADSLRPTASLVPLQAPSRRSLTLPGTKRCNTSSAPAQRVSARARGWWWGARGRCALPWRPCGVERGSPPPPTTHQGPACCCCCCAPL